MSEATLDRHPLRVAFDAGDPDGVAEALAPDVVLNSPITSRFQFEGRDEVGMLLGHVREIVDDLEYVAEFGAGNLHTLVFRGRVGRQELEATDLLTLDEEGKVREMTVFVRPLPGLTALMAALAPRMARERGRARSVAVAAYVRPVAALTNVGDAAGVRLVRPPG